jgi:hypothetical protein
VTATTRLKGVVLDARHAPSLARFWATVLGYEIAPYTEEDLRDLASRGRTPDSDPEVLVLPPDGSDAPPLFVIEVPEGKAGKNRLHLDVWLPGQDVGPLVGLGARVLRAPDEEIDWWVVADPEGNEFCAFPARP